MKNQKPFTDTESQNTIFVIRPSENLIYRSDKDDEWLGRKKNPPDRKQNKTEYSSSKSKKKVSSEPKSLETKEYQEKVKATTKQAKTA